MTQVRGSITVFLTLVMVSILSLVGTMLDLARFQIADHLAYNALVTAVDSQLTNYCKEVYEDYKIFLLDGGKQEEEMNGEEYVTSIRDYINYSFNPQKDINIQGFTLPLSTTDFLSMELTDCTLKGQTHITDQEGEIFQHQIEEYMKYHVPAELAEGLLSKLNLLKNTKTTMSVFRKKMEVEESAAEISQSVLDLITLVEGLTFDDGELQLTKQHFIIIKPSFGKEFCTEKVGPKAVAINHNLVWDSLQNKYTNPVAILTAMAGDNADLITLDKEYKELKQELEKETDAEKRIQLEGEIFQREGRMNELKDTLCKEGLSLVEEAKEVKSKAIEAIDIIEGLKGKKEACENELNSFESYLSTEKEKLDDGSYNAVTEELQELKTYLSDIDGEGVDTSVIGDIMAMKDCLKTNLKALESTINLEPLFIQELEPDFSQRKTEIQKTIAAYKSYSIRSLHFDYTNLNTKPKEDSPVGSLSSFLENGICDLILEDASGLSKQKLNPSNLPSAGMLASANVNNGKDPNAELAKNISNQDNELSSSMGEYEEICNKVEPQEDRLNNLVRRVLLNSYGTNYFKNYTTSHRLKKEGVRSEEVRSEEVLSKPTMIEYEQEYLIIGHTIDEENVKSIISRTVFIRTAMNYLSLLTDSTARNKAFITASAMVGFTGCGPVITVVKHIILMGWGLEEALVDVGALMQGKSVLLFKKASNFSIRYEDLLTISKATVQAKIKKLPEKGKELLSMTYEDYLNFYMYMVGSDTLSYRMMDLIQENTRLRYKEEFLMKNGVFALELFLEYEVLDKFLSIPFIKQFTGSTIQSSHRQVSTEYSY